MKNLIWMSAVVLGVAVAGCDRKGDAVWQASVGSIALSTDDALIYAVDTDNEFLAVVDADTQEKIATVKLGAAPEFVTVGPDDAIYVANRGGRSVSVIYRGEWEEAHRFPVGVEPVSLAVSPDNKLLYVVNGTSLESADYGTLTAIDLGSRQPIWDLPLGEEPRGISLVDGGKTALITLFKKGDILKVDLRGPEVVQDNSKLGRSQKGLVYESANASVETGTANGNTTINTFQPRSSTAVVAHPEGEVVYTSVVWAREDTITTPPNANNGYYASGGPCNMGSVASAGIVTIGTEDGQPMTDDLTACGTFGISRDAEYPPSTLVGPSRNVGTSFGTEAVQGPVAMLVDPTGAWLFVLNRESQNVAILPTHRRGGDDLTFNTSGSTVRDLVKVGAGANGMAITRDARKVYVYNQFDHRIDIIQKGQSGDVVNAGFIQVASDVLPPNVVLGRKLFFSALDDRINNPVTTAVSCNTCHSEGGREDGHVWGFPDGQRQTPALAGRMMSGTAPFHWTGEFEDMKAFMDHTAVLRMGGKGVGETELATLVAYMDHAAPADNPYQRAQPTEAQIRGAQIFQEAECASCHGGIARTDNKNHDVGTLRITDRHPTLGQLKDLNTPSLLGVARTAPYLHDGSAKTLRERITHNAGDRHGKTSHLSPAQVDDLVEFVKTL